MLAVNQRSQRAGSRGGALEGGGRDVLDVVYRSYTTVFELDEGSEMAVIGGLQTVVCGPQGIQNEIYTRERVWGSAPKQRP